MVNTEYTHPASSDAVSPHVHRPAAVAIASGVTRAYDGKPAERGLLCCLTFARTDSLLRHLQEAGLLAKKKVSKQW